MSIPDLDAVQFENLLVTLRACDEAFEWARGKSLAKAWRTCERGDWMLWLAWRMTGEPGWPTKLQVRLAACDCVETALPFIRMDRKTLASAKLALKTFRLFARGKAPRVEVAAASYALRMNVASSDLSFCQQVAIDSVAEAIYSALHFAGVPLRLTPYSGAAAAAEAAYYAANQRMQAQASAATKSLARSAKIVRAKLRLGFKQS